MLPAQGYGLGAIATYGYGADWSAIAVSYGRNTFLLDNLVKQAVSLTADSESAIYPAANLIDDCAASPWRSLDSSAEHSVVADFFVEASVTSVALININLSPSAVVKLQWNTVDSWASPAGEQTFDVSGLALDPPHANLFMALPITQTYRYFRLVISDIANPLGFYEVGEWFMAAKIQVEEGEDFEVTNDQVYPDPNLIHQTEWLQDVVFIRDVEDIRRFALNWKCVRQETLLELREIDRWLKERGTPFVFVPDNTVTPTECFFVRGGSEVGATQVLTAHYDITLNLKEDARGRKLPA